MTRPLKVFLSHAHADAKAVRALYDRLVADGVDAWLDKEKLIPGQDWEREIRKAVREADVVIVCLSKQFNQRGYRQKEVRIALDEAEMMPEGEIFIIPARLEECENLESLRKWHWVDLFEKGGYEKMMSALRLRAGKIGAELQAKKSGISSVLKKTITQRQSKPRSSKPQEVEKKPETTKKKKRKPIKTEYIVALIGAVATIIAALLSSPLIEKWATETPEPTKTIATGPSTTNIELATPTPTKMTTKTPEPAPIILSTLTPIPISSEYDLVTFVNVVVKDDSNCLVEPSLDSDIDSNLVANTNTTAFFVNFDTNGNQWLYVGENDPVCWLMVDKVIYAEGLNELPLFDASGTKMHYIPAGEFIMGSDNAYGDDEKPAHVVFLDAFYMDRYEVTNASYKKCVGSGYCQPPKDISAVNHPVYYDNPEYENFPVINVDWEQAQTYCEWRNAHLPTEAQWEKAARGTDGRTYPWGEDLDCSKANYGKCVGDVTEVGLYADGTSPYFLYDMAGNVWEWVADWYDNKYYTISPYSNPLGPSSSEYRVVRGSAWEWVDFSMPVFTRETINVEVVLQHFAPDIGFRCAKDAP